MLTLSRGLLIVIVCAWYSLKGPDGHPGDVGERGPLGVDGEKAWI